MKLQFHQPFGHHKPGEVVEVPDEAEYDRSYLKPADPDAEATAEEKARGAGSTSVSTEG